MITDTRFEDNPIKKWTFLKWMFLLCWVVAFLSVVGCGGSGGGDDGGGGTPPGLTYSGVTTKAAVTAENAQTLASNALDTGSGGAGFSGVAALDTASNEENGRGRPFFMGLAMVMESAVAKMDRQSAAGQNPPLAVQSDADTCPGSCGGSYSYNIQVDTDTGVFSGTLAFNEYCESGITLNGSTSFSGVVNVSLRQVESCTLSFNSITGTSGSESATMGGQVYIVVSGATTMITMDMMVRDNSDGRVCKIENYQMDITDRGTYAEMTVNGRYYDADYGYVDLDTTGAFLTSDANVYPHAGQLVLHGENGTAGGPTRARLTALSAAECQVEADTDGDGAYDYDSGAVQWTDL
jgi:hypothetical protein